MDQQNTQCGRIEEIDFDHKCASSFNYKTRSVFFARIVEIDFGLVLRECFLGRRRRELAGWLLGVFTPSSQRSRSELSAKILAAAG